MRSRCQISTNKIPDFHVFQVVLINSTAGCGSLWYLCLRCKCHRCRGGDGRRSCWSSYTTCSSYLHRLLQRMGDDSDLVSCKPSSVGNHLQRLFHSAVSYFIFLFLLLPIFKLSSDTHVCRNSSLFSKDEFPQGTCKSYLLIFQITSSQVIILLLLRAALIEQILFAVIHLHLNIINYFSSCTVVVQDGPQMWEKLIFAPRY